MKKNLEREENHSDKSADIENIEDANHEMLTYFSRLYSEHYSVIQDLKSDLFELNVRIDELSKTQNLYALNTDYRKNVFSPLSRENAETEKELSIKKEVDDLKKKRENCEEKIDRENIILKSIDTRLKKLKTAESSIQNIHSEIKEKEKNNNPFVFLNDEKTDADTVSEHLSRISMLLLFRKSVYASNLDRNIRKKIDQSVYQTEAALKFIRSDPERTEISLKNSVSDLKSISRECSDELKNLDYYFDGNKPVSDTFVEFISETRVQHPEIAIDADIADIREQPSVTGYLGLVKICDLIFDNIYRHSGANHIDFQIENQDGVIYVKIRDNGSGISPSDIENAPWYSGLHQAEEIAFLINGHFHIEGNSKTGTCVEISIPVE